MDTPRLVQPTSWDPLDLTAPPPRAMALDCGPGILPDTDHRPEVQRGPVGLPEARVPRGPAVPSAPWDH